MSEGGVQRDVSRTASERILVVVVLATAAIGFLIIRRIQGTIGDEDVYLPQIKRFIAGDWSVDKKLAVTPAYHHVIAFIGRVLRVDSVDALRLISLLLSLVAVVPFYASSRRLSPDTAIVRSYQFLFLPILLPYCFLLYTEPLAIVFLLVAVWLALNRYDTLCGVAGLLSALVRQNLIVWMGFLFFWIYVRDEGFKLSTAALKRQCCAAGSFCLVLPAWWCSCCGIAV